MNDITLLFDIQPTLGNDKVIISPLQRSDFEALFDAAADPEIWEQHPDKYRWKKDIFMVFFDRAIQSGGAFKIVDRSAGRVIGSTRFYDYEEQDNSLFVGYTFYRTDCWGTGINYMVKKMMLDYIFQFVSKVNLYTGVANIRSQMAISRLGAKNLGEREVTYYDKTTRRNFIYVIDKQDWLTRKDGGRVSLLNG